MRYFVIQRKKDGKYYDARDPLYDYTYCRSLCNAYVFDSIATPAKGIIRKGERAIEVEQVWRKKK